MEPIDADCYYSVYVHALICEFVNNSKFIIIIHYCLLIDKIMFFDK